jgi:hypothetical protein
MPRKKRRKPIPYTNMTKKLFGANGWLVDDSERKNCWTGTKNDLFGFADLAGAKEGKRPILIQSTSGSNHLARVKKILTLKSAVRCLKGGYRIAGCSWQKAKNGRWVPRLQEITLADFRAPRR